MNEIEKFEKIFGEENGDIEAEFIQFLEEEKNELENIRKITADIEIDGLYDCVEDREVREKIRGLMKEGIDEKIKNRIREIMLKKLEIKVLRKL